MIARNAEARRKDWDPEPEADDTASVVVQSRSTALHTSRIGSSVGSSRKRSMISTGTPVSSDSVTAISSSFPALANCTRFGTAMRPCRCIAMTISRATA